jgi:Ca2+-dependent lipid-binding protein
MKTLEEIKKEYLDKKLTKSQIKKELFLCKLTGILILPVTTYVISLIPFFIGFGIVTLINGYSTIIALFFLTSHLYVYNTRLKKTNDEFDKEVEEIENHKKVLNEILE